MNDAFVNKAVARKVRAQLEQALLTLPRQCDEAIALAHQIEEAIDVAIELEFSRPTAMLLSKPLPHRHASAIIVRL